MKDNVSQNIKNFEKGHSYCNLGWGGAQKYYVSKKSPFLKSLIHALPPGLVHKGGVQSFSYFNKGSSFAVSNNSQQQELAYLFILFASSPLPSTLSIREASGHFDPYRLEHYADSLIQNTYGKRFLTVHKRGLTNCLPDLYLHGQGEYSHALRANIDLALHKKLKPHQAMKVIASEWEKITEAHGRASQLEQWRAIQMNYPKKLQRLLK
jgi:multiple sugar transport system substrate-binding protein